MERLLIFTFSPVQGFISTSRRPRDLFTASFILSYLSERVAKFLLNSGAKLIYPQIEESKEGLANYPNKVLAIVYGENLEERVEEEFKKVWEDIYESVWKGLSLKGPREQYLLHVKDYFNPFSLSLPLIDERYWRETLKVEEEVKANKYSFTYDLVGRLLGAKKTWRPYKALVDDYTYDGYFPDGCTMCGERLHLAIDWDRESLKKLFKEEDLWHIRGGEKLCGVCLVKRFAVKYYFHQRKILKREYWSYPSTEEVAGIKFKEALAKMGGEIKEGLKALEEDLKDTPFLVRREIVKGSTKVEAEIFRREAWESLFKSMEEVLGREKLEKIKEKIIQVAYEIKKTYKLEHKNPYFAILLSDGDNVGNWLSIKSTIRKEPLSESFHKEFSKRLCKYAKDVVEINRYPKLIIYAGGDDLMAFMHPYDVVSFAKECNNLFFSHFQSFAKEGQRPTISAGILITHARMNLQKSLESVRGLEKRAKNGVEGKGAVCVGVLTKVGSLTYFLCKWEEVELYLKLVELFKRGYISSNLPYELRDVVKERERSEIFLTLLRRAIRRKVQENYQEEVFKTVESFLKRTGCYLKDACPITNLVNMLYVARFVGKLEEVGDEAV